MKLKSHLLFEIINNSFASPNRYSKAFSNLSMVLKLEENEKFSFPEIIITEFSQITTEYHNFLAGIGVRVIERYYLEHREKLNKMVFFEFEGKEITDIKIIELYEKLEIFYGKMFELACQIASYYNLEIKLNKGAINQNENTKLFGK